MEGPVERSEPSGQGRSISGLNQQRIVGWLWRVADHFADHGLTGDVPRSGESYTASS